MNDIKDGKQLYRPHEQALIQKLRLNCISSLQKTFS
jgi:hypothetical protein